MPSILGTVALAGGLRYPYASDPGRFRAELAAFVKEAVEPGSTVVTDGWEGYHGLEGGGYLHEVKVIRGSGKTASALLPRVRRVASLLKRWLLGTHQGAVSVELFASQSKNAIFTLLDVSNSYLFQTCAAYPIPSGTSN